MTEAVEDAEESGAERESDAEGGRARVDIGGLRGVQGARLNGIEG